MSNYIILTDSNCELNKDLRERFGLEDYIKGHIVTPDGVDHRVDLEWELFGSPDKFYTQLKDKKNVFSTSAPNSAEFIEFFSKYLEQGRDIIFLSMSTALSGTYDFAVMAKNELAEKYPDRRIEIFNTLRYSCAVGLLTVTALKLQQEGKTYDEVLEFLNKNYNRVHEMGPMDDLFFLSRKGRISYGKAFMGTLVGVKPLGDFNKNGLTTVLTKALGLKKAMAITIEYVKRTIENPEEQIIFIAETDRRKNAEILADLLKKEVKPKEVIIITCNPSTGANVGPGLAACYYFGKEISDDLVEETKLMEEITGKDK